MRAAGSEGGASSLSAPALRVGGQHVLIEQLLQRLGPLVTLPDVAVGVMLGEFDELALRTRAAGGTRVSEKRWVERQF